MRVFGQLTTSAGHGDVLIQETKGIFVGTPNDIELPRRGAVTTLDAGFWSSWLAQNSAADFVRRHLVYQVG
jgi:hypothetical protein